MSKRIEKLPILVALDDIRYSLMCLRVNLSLTGNKEIETIAHRLSVIEKLIKNYDKEEKS